MSRSTLRPCLKHSTDLDPPAPPINTPLPFALCSSALGPRVHFPPTPGLCRTHLTHSPAIYDRAPIVVQPNACALPERNERTYTPTNEPSSPKNRRPRHAALHPQAFASSTNAKVTSSEVAAADRVPSLIHDSSTSSSESDESDVSSVPPNPTHFASMGHPPISLISSVGDATAALSFLPHANEHDKPRRERSHSRSRGGSRSMRKSEFAQPELDGCLGGF